ncbi:hypothetical protein VKT23_011009 [Stygiomarasmius scandens]|uniref:SAM domain-containing protein n=1 Tax=Marasmiellus scandens TaxID=2682957 RepID=A0ABR1JAG6_9AGAR
MHSQRSIRGVQLVAKLQRPSVSSHSSSEDPFDRGEIVLTPYEELYEHTRDLVVPVANRKLSEEELSVESIRTQPTWPFRFEYVITKSIFVSEIEHWYPDHINRYWVKNQDLKKLGAISTEQIRKLTTKLLKYEGGANEWLKDIRREARKVKRSKKVCGLSEQESLISTKVSSLRSVVSRAGTNVKPVLQPTK